MGCLYLHGMITVLPMDPIEFAMGDGGIRPSRLGKDAILATRNCPAENSTDLLS